MDSSSGLPAEEEAVGGQEGEVVPIRPPRRPRGFFTRGDSALERFSAAVASAAASVSNTFNTPGGNARSANDELLLNPDLDDDQDIDEMLEETITENNTISGNESPGTEASSSPRQNDDAGDEMGSSRSDAGGATMASSSSNTLRVPPSGYGGAIPRRTLSRDSSAESNASTGSTTDPSLLETKTCFCGHYTEQQQGPSAAKRGRCKFCRSRAKYVSGQRSFDASRLFGRRRERGEPRRAASEDQRKPRSSKNVENNEKAIDERNTTTAAVSTSSLDVDLSSSTSGTGAASSYRRAWRLKPSVRRQARLDLDTSSTNMGNDSISPSRDHGLRTPPGPPVPSTSIASASSNVTNRPRRPTTLQDPLLPPEAVETNQRYATHLMASDMWAGLLAPPLRAGALSRAHTDPTSAYDPQLQVQHQPPQPLTLQRTPNSPPPTYEEVMKQPRVAPPSYEEALSSRVVTSLRMGQTGSNVRSLSEDRVSSHPSPPPPFRGRNSSGNLRPLTRSSRVEEIPDIYWEQAARELDFCTCRKCQARYRQYFEEDLADPNNDAEAMIPMETQVLMQEVLTDGMAFCSLM